MPIISFFPHKIRYRIMTGGREEPNGDYSQGDEVWLDDCECDAVRNNGEEVVIDYLDGEDDGNHYIVYLPNTCRDYHIHESVEILLEDGKWHRFKVKGFSRKQLRCKLWV